MKKTLYIVVLLIVGLMLGSCNKKANTEEADKNKTEKVAKSKEELKKLVKELDEECPYEFSTSTEEYSIQSIELKDEEVKMTISSNQITKDVIEMCNKNKKVASESMLNSMSYWFKKDEQMAPLFSKMIEAETGLVIEFKAPTGEKCTLKASVDEVSNAQDANAKDVIKSSCKLLNAVMAEQETDGMTMKMSVESNYAVLTLTIDDEYYQQFVQFKEIYQSSMRESIIGSDPEELEVWRESGLGIKYIFANADTGEKFVTKIENYEL